MRRYIRNIKIGDKVKVYNTRSNTFDISRVSKTFQYLSDHYYMLNGKIRVTGTHPFYVKDDSDRGYSWVKVEDLKVGDKLFTKNDKISKLKSINRVDNPLVVHNIEVDGQHNYFASGFLVHNKIFGGAAGEFHGSDTKAQKGRDAANDAVENWNIDSTLTGIEAFDKAVGGASDAAETIGAVETVVDENEEPLRTGLHKTLFDALQAANRTKVGAKKEAGADFRDNQKIIANTLSTANVIGPQEKVEIEQRQELEMAGEEAEDEASFEMLKAKADFKTDAAKARTDAMGDAADEIKGYQREYDIYESTLQSEWALGSASGAIEDNSNVSENLTSNASKGSGVYQVSGDKKWAKNPVTRDHEGAMVFKEAPGDDPAGTLANISAKAPNLVTEKWPEDPDISAETSKTISDIWSKPIIALQGPNADTFGGTKTEGAYVYKKGVCFAGNTFIEVIE